LFRLQGKVHGDQCDAGYKPMTERMFHEEMMGTGLQKGVVGSTGSE
jgi:hypothetical protein